MERRAAHRALADGLPDADGDRRAWHLALAAIGPDAAASSALEQAGARALGRSAYEVSSRMFERAAALTLGSERRGSLLYAAADAAWLAGLGDRAVRLLDEARQHEPEPALQLRVEHLRAHIAIRRGHVREGRSVLLKAVEAAPLVDPPQAVVMLAEAVDASFYAGDAASMRRIATLIPAVAGGCVDARSKFFATMSEGMALVLGGEGRRGPESIRDAVTMLQRSDELRDDPRLLAWAVIEPLWLREATGGTALVEHALNVARTCAATGTLPRLLSHIAIHRAATDQWAEAEAEFHEAIAVSRESRTKRRIGHWAGAIGLAGGAARQGGTLPGARLRSPPVELRFRPRVVRDMVLGCVG